jgi:hypothetical protein
MLIEMSRIPYKNYISRFILILLTFFTIISIVTKVEIKYQLYVLAFISVIILTAFIFGTFVIQRNLGNRFRNKTTQLLLVAGTIGIIIPFLSFLGMTFFNFAIPFTFISILSVVTPVIVGRNFIEQSQLNDIITRKIHSYQFALDFLSGLIVTLILVSIFFVSEVTQRFALPVLTILNLIILYLRYFTYQKIRDDIMSGKRQVYRITSKNNRNNSHRFEF